MEFLERIQSKPREVKAHYAFVFSAFITGVIGLVWLSTLPSRFGEISIVPPPAEESEINDLTNLINSTKTQLGNAIDSLQTEKEEVVTENLDGLGREDGFDTQFVEPTREDTVEGILVGETRASSTSRITEQGTTKGVEGPRVILIGTTTEKSTE